MAYPNSMSCMTGTPTIMAKVSLSRRSCSTSLITIAPRRAQKPLRMISLRAVNSLVNVVVISDCPAHDSLLRRGRWPARPEGDSVSQHEDHLSDGDRVPLRPSGTSPCGGGNYL